MSPACRSPVWLWSLRVAGPSACRRHRQTERQTQVALGPGVSRQVSFDPGSAQHRGQIRKPTHRRRLGKGLQPKAVLETRPGAEGPDVRSARGGLWAEGCGESAPSPAPGVWGCGVSAVLTPASGRWPVAVEASAGVQPSWRVAKGRCSPHGLWPRRTEGDVKVADGGVFLN